MLEMRAAPGCFICIMGGCLADAGTTLPHLGVILAHLGAMLNNTITNNHNNSHDRGFRPPEPPDLTPLAGCRA